MKGSSNQNNNTLEEEEDMTLPRVECDDQDILFAKYLDQIYEETIMNFEPLPTLVDDSNMLYNNVGSSSLSNHIVPTLKDEENISNLGPVSKLDDDSNMLNNNVVPDLVTLPKCSYNQDRKDTNLPPIPQSSCNQLSSGMSFDQYPQNPIQPFEETQYEILEPWLLAECVPFWEP